MAKRRRCKNADIESEVLKEIQAAVDGAEEKMKALGDPIDMFEHAYARMPTYLKEQKEAFAEEVAEMTEVKNSG